MAGTGIRNIAATALVAAVFAFFFFGPDTVLLVAMGAALAAALRGRGGFARPGLAVIAVANALILLVLAGFLQLAFSFNCGSDTSTPEPGSDLAGYCDTLEAHSELELLIVFGPALFALGLGLVAAQKLQPGRVTFAILAGLGLTIAAQVPGWLLATSSWP